MFGIGSDGSGVRRPVGAHRAALGLLLLVGVVLAGCGGGDAGLTRAEVEDIVRAEAAEAASAGGLSDQAQTDGAVNDEGAATPAPQGLTRAEVEDIVRAEAAEAASAGGLSDQAQTDGAVNDEGAAMPEAQGLTRAEVQDIVRAAIAAVPPKTAPADYTKHVVANAIAHYQTEGLDATVAHYNRPESVDGQWYVFIIDGNDIVIAHPDPQRRGLDLNGWVGTDANGYQFGPDMLSADDNGKWVSYVYKNPQSGSTGLDYGELELKNVWAQRRDGLLFASGWYIDADDFTQQLVSTAVDKYRELGLPGTMAYFASPDSDSALAGLEAAIDYYNTAETVDGRWFAFIGDPDGTIVGHSNPAMIGHETQDILDTTTTQPAHEDGRWIQTETLRVFLAGYDGHLFGSGWHQDNHDPH